MNDQEAFEQHLSRVYGDPVAREMARDMERETWNAALAWLRSQGDPVAWIGQFDGLLYREQADVGDVPLFLASQPIPDGHVIAPAFRGYAVMGAGEYLLDCCPPDEYGPSLVISIATEDEKAGRVVGDLRDPIPGKLIQPEVMAIRIDFLTVAGLDALEQQLRILRADYFEDSKPAIPDGWQSEASRDVLAERRRQVEAEDWTPEHDDAHGDGSMCMAAVCYAEWDHYEHPNGDGEGLIPINWPWSAKWWKPRDRRRNLVKAAALLLAEIERMDRASTSTLEPSK